MVFAIIGIILAVFVLIVASVLLMRVKLVLGFYDDGKFGFKIKVLFFEFGGDKPKNEKKKKEDSDFIKNLKSRLGLDVLGKEEFKASIENGSFTDKVSRLVALVMLFLGQVKYLFSKLRVDRLYSLIICGGDGAEAAIDYGLVCSAIYPLAGYLDASLNMKKNAQDVQVYCDFEGQGRIEFELILSIRTAYILKAAMGMLGDASMMANQMEETQNGNGK